MDAAKDTPAGTAAATLRKDVCAVVVLLTVAIVVHGHSLRVGFWLDDHNHLELCQAHGFRDLTAGNVFVGRCCSGSARAWTSTTV